MSVDPMIEQLTGWAQARADVRAMILTSTRAVPDAHVDAYSDYDLIIVVEDVRSRAAETSWLADFGEVLVAYWDPVWTDPGTGAERVSSVVNYADGLKIDWSLWSTSTLTAITDAAEPDAEFDAGYRVLVDKDGLTRDLPAPTYRSYVPVKPDEETFQRLVTDFLIGVPYVAKGLLRNQLLLARWVLDFDMRFTYLVPMLEWRVECDHGWSLKSGNLGKWLEDRLSPDVWAELETTFADADHMHTWDALFAMVSLFDRVAGEVAEHLGYPSPHDDIERVARHARRMRAGDFADGPLRSPHERPDDHGDR